MIKQLRLTRFAVERRRLGISQQDLAGRLGVTQPRISAWETGRTPIPRARRKEIADILQIGEADLDTFVDL